MFMNLKWLSVIKNKEIEKCSICNEGYNKTIVEDRGFRFCEE